jgi:hypothetical protein
MTRDQVAVYPDQVPADQWHAISTWNLLYIQVVYLPISGYSSGTKTSTGRVPNPLLR